MADPKFPSDFTKEEKQILIDFMTEAGYGKYTDMENLDYKFFEDTSHAENLFLMVREIAELRKYKASVEFAIDRVNFTHPDVMDELEGHMGMYRSLDEDPN